MNEKEKYITPETEVISFDTEDVITTSNTRMSGHNGSAGANEGQGSFGELSGN